MNGRRRTTRLRASAKRRSGMGVRVERLEPRAMLATISGSVQQSFDVAGLDPNSPLFVGIPEVTVQLRDGAGSLIAEQTTDTAGGYAFSGVTAGRHALAVVPPRWLLRHLGAVALLRTHRGPR
jgi:hypothetical protein